MAALTAVVARVPSLVEAQLIVGMLQSNDIDAAVSADDAGGFDPQPERGAVEGVDDADAPRRCVGRSTARNNVPAAVDAMPIESGRQQDVGCSLHRPSLDEAAGVEARRPGPWVEPSVRLVAVALAEDHHLADFGRA